MQINNYLEQNQPIIFKTFANALKNNHLSHAYLLSGQPGTPLLETAKFLAKSILCDSPNPLACDSCLTCMRVDDNNYPDFFIFDGSASSIKKDDVSSIESAFEMKAFESKGVRIYILHLVENMTTEAVNAILKFLEEPGNKIYAFLTTNNENTVLPTIISRCQVLRLKLVDRNTVISDAKNLDINSDDAEILSYLFNSGELIQEKLNDKDFGSMYSQIKEVVAILLESLQKDNKNNIFYKFDTYVMPKVKEKEAARLFLDILIDVFQNSISLKNGGLSYLKNYDTILNELSNRIPNMDKKLIELLKQRSLLNLNVNVSLLFDHIISEIVKEILW